MKQQQNWKFLFFEVLTNKQTTFQVFVGWAWVDTGVLITFKTLQFFFFYITMWIWDI